MIDVMPGYKYYQRCCILGVDRRPGMMIKLASGGIDGRSDFFVGLADGISCANGCVSRVRETDGLGFGKDGRWVSGLEGLCRIWP
jgi:hypothetical protein